MSVSAANLDDLPYGSWPRVYEVLVARLAEFGWTAVGLGVDEGYEVLRDGQCSVAAPREQPATTALAGAREQSGRTLGVVVVFCNQVPGAVVQVSHEAVTAHIANVQTTADGLAAVQWYAAPPAGACRDIVTLGVGARETFPLEGVRDRIYSALALAVTTSRKTITNASEAKLL